MYQGSLFTILFNGIISEFFQSLVKLCQECLLSSYLFIICVDILSRALKAAMVYESLKAYQSITNPQPLSHFFVDDCLLLAKVNVSNAMILRMILE